MLLLFNRFKKMVTLLEKSHWYNDFVRGVTHVRIQMSQVPEAAFSEMDRIRLSYRLTKINKRLFNAYQILGQQAIDCFVGNAPSVSEEELERLYQQIEVILEDQKKTEAEIEELGAPSSMKEGS